MKSIAFWLAWLKGECGIELSFSTTLSFCEDGLNVSALFRSNSYSLRERSGGKDTHAVRFVDLFKNGNLI